MSVSLLHAARPFHLDERDQILDDHPEQIAQPSGGSSDLRRPLSLSKPNLKNNTSCAMQGLSHNDDKQSSVCVMRSSILVHKALMSIKVISHVWMSGSRCGSLSLFFRKKGCRNLSVGQSPSGESTLQIGFTSSLISPLSGVDVETPPSHGGLQGMRIPWWFLQLKRLTESGA